MTTKNDNGTTTQSSDAGKSADELAQKDAELDEQAAFDVGFAETRGSKPPDGAKERFDDASAAEAAADKQEATTTDGTTSAAAPAKGADGALAKDVWEGVHPQVRAQLEAISRSVGDVAQLAKSTAGRVGTLQSALDAGRKAASSAGGDQPTQEAVALAMADPEAWKAFEEEFPDFAKPVKAQFEAMHKELAKKAAPAVDVAKIKQEARTEALTEFEGRQQVRETRLVVREFPEYVTTVNTPEFAAWLQSQPAPMKAKADSRYSEDAIDMLRAFDAHAKAAREASERNASEKDKKQERLRRAAQPSGTGAPARGAPSEEEAFAEGFNAVRGGRG